MPNSTTVLKCQCGEVSFSVIDEPIISAECLCSDCQAAGAFLQKQSNSPKILDENGATRFVIYRKDRVKFHSGQEKLIPHYLNQEKKTRRVISGCCNTPIFLEFKNGHWLSIYGLLWSTEKIPPLEIRTMTRSRPRGIMLPNDVPNPKTHTLLFYFKLFKAWAVMGFKAPKINLVVDNINDK